MWESSCEYLLRRPHFLTGAVCGITPPFPEYLSLLMLEKSLPGTRRTKLDLPRLTFWLGSSQGAREPPNNPTSDMPHGLSHSSPSVPVFTCSALSSLVQQRFSGFSLNPYKMPPREHHHSLKTEDHEMSPWLCQK